MTDATSDNNKSAVDPSEPSMEDILASIRQLIADDGGEGSPLELDSVPLGSEQAESSIVSDDEAAEPLELTVALEDENDELLSGLIDTDVTDFSMKGVPSIEITPAQIASEELLSDDIELPVQHIIDDMLERAVDSGSEANTSTDVGRNDGATTSDLMSEIVTGSDLKDGQSLGQSGAETTHAIFESEGLSENLGAAAMPVLTASHGDDTDVNLLPVGDDDDLGVSIDDLLNELSTDIDMTATGHDPDNSEEADSVTTALDSDDSEGNAEPSADDDSVSMFGSESELGQDFDDLMASFLSDDDTVDAKSEAETDSEFVSDIIADEAVTAEAAEAVDEVNGDNDAESTDFGLNRFFDDFLAGQVVKAEINEDVTAAHETHHETHSESGTDTDLQLDPTAAEETLKMHSNIEASILDLDDDLAVEGFLPDFGAEQNSAVEDRHFDEMISDSPEHAATHTEDPDIELVKSLMAELTDMPEDIGGRNLDGGDDTVHIDMAKKMDAAEGEFGEDIFSELFNETLSSEEELQADIQSRMSDEIAAISSNAPPRSPLSDLADEIASETDTEVVDVSKIDDTQNNGALTGLAAGSLLTAVMAQTTARPPSALDALMSDDGMELEADLEPSLTEADQVVSETDFDALISGFSNDVSAKDMPQEDAAIDAVGAEELTAHVDSDFDLRGKQGDSSTQESGSDELSIIVEAAPVEQLSAAAPSDENVEGAPDLDLVADLLVPETDGTLDDEAETMNINPELPEVEIEDMAVKPARETILDEVTETAAASAFASLNQVVEEKTIVAERGDRIGDLVTSALQPMLKDWLDANLKGIVERAVQKEVKRISSGK